MPPSVTPTLHFDSLDVLEERYYINSRGVIEYLLQSTYLLRYFKIFSISEKGADPEGSPL